MKVKGNNMKKKQLGTVFALGLLFGPVAAEAQYEYQRIDYPGQAETNVWGINDSGDAVGVGFGPDNIPFTYASMDGTIIDVAPAAGFLSTSLLGINDAGVMVGTVESLDGNSQSGVIRSKDGEYTVFNHPDAVTATTGRGVNNRGLVSGTYIDANGTLGGFLYDPMTDTFTNLVPSQLTIAHGINSKGVVVGDARFAVDPCGGVPPSERYGWVRAKDGSIVLFQVNGQRTVARGINDAGFVAGNVFDQFTGELKGFVIKAPKTNCATINVDAADLMQFPGASQMFPEGITNSGDVVGIFFDASGAAHGFIAIEQ